MGGGGGSSGPSPLPKGFNDPWIPNARYEFGHTGENAYPQEDYYKKGGPYWPRGGVDENGEFVEGEYSYNPVGRYNRSIMDFIKSGATVPASGGSSSSSSTSNGTGSSPSGIDQWLAVVGSRPEPAQPRPELMPGGYPLSHPATALQTIGGIQGGFSSGSSGTGASATGGFNAPRGETKTPDRYVQDYIDQGLTPPGYVSRDWVMDRTNGQGFYGKGMNQDYALYTGRYQPLIPVTDVNGEDKWVIGSHNKYSKYYDSPEDVPLGR